MPSPTPFEIYGASTSLLRKNKCSTYTKYVSALFLLAPRICAVYFKRLTEGASFQKRWFKNLRRIYGVIRQKSVLNVSEAARMPLVPISNVFALQTRRSKMYMDVHF